MKILIILSLIVSTCSICLGQTKYNNYPKVNTTSALLALDIAEKITVNEAMSAFDDMLENAYNESPSTLANIDTAVTQYEREEISFEEYQNRIRESMQFMGHDAGYYMASLTRNVLGVEVLINDFDDPIAFVETYNKAAKLKEGEYVFSTEFMEILERKRAE